MADDTDGYDDYENGFTGTGDVPGRGTVDDEPPTYHSGRVRIIGAEPAGDSVREVTGPVEEGHPDLPHWNDAPTGQVPPILDRSTGEESAVLFRTSVARRRISCHPPGTAPTSFSSC